MAKGREVSYGLLSREYTAVGGGLVALLAGTVPNTTIPDPVNIQGISSVSFNMCKKEKLAIEL